MSVTASFVVKDDLQEVFKLPRSLMKYTKIRKPFQIVGVWSKFVECFELFVVGHNSNQMKCRGVCFGKSCIL